MSALLFFAAEVVAFVEVGNHIGFGWAVLILIGVSALGPFVIRRVGMGVLTRAQDRLARGDIPTRELLDGVVVLGGGVMICVPGFISDALGLLLMIGPIRSLVLRTAGQRLARRVRTTPLVNWRVMDVGSRPRPSDAPNAAEFSQKSIEPGDHPDV